MQRWRLVMRRGVLDPADAGRAQASAWEDALARSGLPAAGLDAPSGRPRVAPAAPLAAAIPGEAELVDIWLTERVPRWRVRDALLAAMPPAHELVDLFDVWLGEPPLPGQVVASVYRARIDDPRLGIAALAAAAEAVMASPEVRRERAKGDRTVAYDLRPLLDRIEVRERGSAIEVVMTLRHDPEKGVGRPEEVLAELAERSGTALTPAELVRERLVLASERPSSAAPPAPIPRFGGPGRLRRPRPRAT